MDPSSTYYLENATLESICDDIYNALERTIGRNHPELTNICSKLKQYRYVADINHLHQGKHVRWLKLPGLSSMTTSGIKLSAGGIVVDIRDTDRVVIDAISRRYTVVILNYAKQPMQYKFDDYLTFQKLTDQEMIILLTKRA